jgi:hypothetical protein
MALLVVMMMMTMSGMMAALLLLLFQLSKRLGMVMPKMATLVVGKVQVRPAYRLRS